MRGEFSSVKDFYEKFTNYAKSIAKNTGRKLAISIDDHSGGHGTNRPTLFGFINNEQPSLKKVLLKSGEDTTFNGYDITNETYLVR